MKLGRLLSNPKALMAFGIISVVGGAVATGIGTAIALKEVEKDKEKINMLKEAAKGEILYVEDGVEKDEKAATQQLGIACIKTAGKVALSYAPAAGLVTLGILGLTRSYKILNARNIALTGALTSLSAAFNQYRGRVIEKYGEDVDRQLRLGTEQRKIEEIDEDGKSTKVKEEVFTENSSPIETEIIFDEECTEWKSSSDYCLMFLECIQNQLTTTLAATGHVFLNELFDAIGHKRTEEGAVTGWLYKEGDGYVDLRVKTFKRVDEAGRTDTVYVLDPNTDGVIISKLDD